MAISFPDHYWIEFPGGKYTVGLLPEEARMLAAQSAAYFEHRGAEFSINDGKMMRRAIDLMGTTANPAWVEQYLLAHYPAREVELAPFAIARRPITGGEYRQFMKETGESEEPHSWRLGREFCDDDRPIRGIAWAAAVAFAKWAGARLPFEEEWERAMRSSDRRLFPWGNEFSPLGWDLIDDESPKLWTVDATMTPEGVGGALIGMHEWCANYWVEPAGIQPARWKEIAVVPDARPARGGFSSSNSICSSIASTPFDATSYHSNETGLRLMRADGRLIPPLHPQTAMRDVQHFRVREFEVHTLRPILNELASSKIAWDHAIDVDVSDYYLRDGTDQGAQEVKRAVHQGCARLVTWGRAKNSTEYIFGLFFTATSRESIRRIPKQHGVFVWNIHYRYADDGRVLAHPSVAYHMAFNKRIHQFTHRFREHEADTPIDEITPEMVAHHLTGAFLFYETHADDPDFAF